MGLSGVWRCRGVESVGVWGTEVRGFGSMGVWGCGIWGVGWFHLTPVPGLLHFLTVEMQPQ